MAAFRLGARGGRRAALPFGGREWLPRPEEQAEGGWAHARYPGPSAGGAAQGGGGVGVPRMVPLRPGAWQGRAGSSGPTHGWRPEAAEAGSPWQPRQGGGGDGDGGGEGGSGPRGPVGGKKKKKNQNRLPKRWTDYRPLGKRMPGTRFIAFKVPLKKSFEWSLARDERFSPLDLITQVEQQKEELGLIIDLTYTTHYYEPTELPDTLQYCKIVTIGHKVPNPEIVSEFKSTVKQFLRENQHNDKLIGVHCTHGLNRTGYLVCRYLIDVEGMDPNIAIELFNRCRGHCIERKNYISALRRTPERRNHHYMDASQRDWMNGHVGYSPSPDYEVADYGRQNWKHPPRNLTFRRGGRSQRRQHSEIWNHTCYSEGSQVYSPQYPPSANIVHQSSGHNVIPSNRLFFPQEQFQGYQGPSFQELNPHGSLQQ